MLISVLMPVYNVESFIEEAIYSICNQTHKNLEIIIIDDCSTDNTFPLVTNIAKKDSRIKLYRNQENLKLVATLNKGLNYVSGDYVIRMDGDDVSFPDRIEKMFAYLTEHPDCVLVGSQVITINEQGIEIGYSNLPINQTMIKKVCPYISPILHIWMCKTSLYRELKGYRDIIGAEDYDFILRTISSGYKIANLPDKLYKVRIRQGNTVSTIGLKQEISHMYCVDLYRERIKNTSLIDSYNINCIYNKFNISILEQKIFVYNYSIFRKGFNLIKEKKYWGMCYIFISFIKSKYIRHYIINRICFRIIMLLGKIL